MNRARLVSNSKFSLCVYARQSVGRSAALNLSTMSKWELTHPRVRSGGSQMTMVSNSSSGVLSRSNGRKIASTVNSTGAEGRLEHGVRRAGLAVRPPH